MGNSLLCCTAGHEKPANSVCCQKHFDFSYETHEQPVGLDNPVSEELIGFDLDSFKLADDADDSLGDALRELQDAARLYREGECLEAVQKLTAAEEKIERSPTSKNKADLQRSLQSDSELKDLRMLMASNFAGKKNNDDAVAKPDAETAAVNTAQAQDKAQTASTPLKEVNERAPSKTSIDTDGALRAQKLAALEAELGAVRKLCRAARVLEAYPALESLQQDVSSAQRLAEETADKQLGKLLAALNTKLRSDPMLAKLRAMQTRMAEAVALLNVPQDSRGVSLEVRDPKLGEDFVLRMNLRFAEGAERDKNGPATQLIVRGDVKNFPAPLLNVITENCETDLFQKEWVKDCKAAQGKPGRPARMYCSLVHLSLAPSLLPIKVEDVLLREFAICPGEGLLKNRGPGVLVVEYRAPDGVTDFEGMPIPPKRSGVIRVKGGMSSFYKTQSQKPGFANIVAVSKLGVPFPQYLLPLGLLKKFAADLFLNSIRAMKDGLYDKWEDLDYKNRASQNPDLYTAVAELPPDLLPPK